MSKIKRYIWNWLIAIDQFLNVILGGDPDETISSRSGKLQRKGGCPVCNWLCSFLDWIDPGHCERVIEPDEGGRDVIK